MSLCEACHTRSERPCAFSARTREYFDAMIAALRYRAYRCGYAITVHGSLKTDIDLVAVPWRDSAVSAEYLAEEVRLMAESIIGIARKRDADLDPTKKPCGRLAWSFYLQPEGMEGPYIDLSVFPPPRPHDEAPKPALNLAQQDQIRALAMSTIQDDLHWFEKHGHMERAKELLAVLYRMQHP